MAKKLSPAAAVPLVVPAHVVAAAPALAAAVAALPRAKKAKAPAAQAPAVKAKLDRSAFTHCVWIGNSARPKLWLKALNELGPALGGISPRKLQNIHIAELKRVNLKITPTLED